MIINVICWLDNLQMLIVRRKGSQDNHYQCCNKIILLPLVFYEHPFCIIFDREDVKNYDAWRLDELHKYILVSKHNRMQRTCGLFNGCD